MDTGLIALNQAEKNIEEILVQFETNREIPSEFEQGQEQGLRWALDIIRAIKSPED